MLKTLIAAAAIALAPVAASAASLFDGDITFTGGWTTTSGSIAGADVQDIIFINPEVQASAGDFVTVGIVGGDTATMQTLELDPVNTPIANFWVVEVAAFDLDDITHINYDGGSVIVDGTGTLNVAGYLPTAGTWSFSGNQAGSILSFSAASTFDVPLPAGAWLLIGGLGGLAALKRRKKA